MRVKGAACGESHGKCGQVCEGRVRQLAGQRPKVKLGQLTTHATTHITSTHLNSPQLTSTHLNSSQLSGQVNCQVQSRGAAG